MSCMDVQLAILLLWWYVFAGNVKFVMMDTADPIEQGKISTMKKLIQTYIPEGSWSISLSLNILFPLGYSPELGRIKDIYKVFICQRKMYMEPFMQRGLSHYHHPCCYTVSSFGPQVSEPDSRGSCILICVHVFSVGGEKGGMV